MSLLVIHFVRNPKSFFDKIDEFALKVGCKQRFIGRSALVQVDEWQVDLLDNLPLYLLSSRHVVVADDWHDDLLRMLKIPDTRIKHEMSLF